MIIALVVFVVLLATGAALQELEWPQILAWVAAAVAVFVVVVALRWSPAALCGTIALMDAILVVVIFKGDITLR
jgi:hypothetical protein